MSEFVFKMPDLGEGTVEAEIVAWRTKVGDVVAEDQVIVEVMTDKAAVEVPAPVAGRVISTTGVPGDKVPVGAPLIVFDMAADTPAAAGDAAVAAAASVPETPAALHAASAGGSQTGRVMTSPANRRRAHEAGIDLASVQGSGPHGRILRGDLSLDGASPAAPRVAASAGPVAASADRAAASADRAAASMGRAPAQAAGEVEEIKIIGLRRMIAERMSEAKRSIPHFAYIDEVDVTELDGLRRHLNGKLAPGEAGLTYLPFVVAALTRVLRQFPQCNARYDASRGVLQRFASVHVGIATQTPEGLKVPVVHDAQAMTLWDLGAAIRRVSESARANTASREELTGSTITVTSLGKLGGIASTPIINMPEVAIIGLNKAVERPVVLEGTIVVRRMMNLSSSFDHRFVDGYDAAAMIQMLKEHLEHPASIFIPR